MTTYTPEKQAQAMRLIYEGKPRAEICKITELGRRTVGSWELAYRRGFIKINSDGTYTGRMPRQEYVKPKPLPPCIEPVKTIIPPDDLRTLTGRMMGDPMPGRSALDQRKEVPAPDSELPDWEDLRGCAPDATGSLSSEDFVRELRDGWR